MALPRLLTTPASPWLALAGVAVALGAVSAPQAHATFIADAPDPAGDAASPDPGLDIVALGLGYDRPTGHLGGAIMLRGAPTVPAIVSLVAARRSPTGCDRAPAIGFATTLDSSRVFWQRMSSTTVVTAGGEVRKTGTGQVFQHFEVTDRRLAGVRPDCVTVTLVDAANPLVVYDSAGPLQLERRPGLAVDVAGVPERVRSGRIYRLRVRVFNPGEAPTGRVQVRLAGARGLTASPRSVRLKSIAPGGRRTATIRVRLGERARYSTRLEATASAGRLRTSAGRRVRVVTPSRPATRPGPVGGPSRSCVRFFPDMSGQTGGSLGLVPC